MTLSDNFHKLLADTDKRPEAIKDAVELVMNAPDTSERAGLMALMYHEGIGVDIDLDKCFELACKAAFEGHDGLGYFLIGYMCDNAETPKHTEGGSGQKYNRNDAKRFYEACSEIDCRWREEAVIWLGDYYMNPVQGNNPETAVKYYESIADVNAKAACRLSDYYWELINPEAPLENQDMASRLFKWTSVAASRHPEEYAFRLGSLYTCGIGCILDFERAIDLFEEAYEYGDWRGAQAIAATLAEYLNDNPEISAEERNQIECNIEQWIDWAEEMRQQGLLDDPEEQDCSIEED